MTATENHPRAMLADDSKASCDFRRSEVPPLAEALRRVASAPSDV